MHMLLYPLLISIIFYILECYNRLTDSKCPSYENLVHVVSWRVTTFFSIGFYKSTFSTTWSSSQIFNTWVTQHMSHQRLIGSKCTSDARDLYVIQNLHWQQTIEYVISWAEVSWKFHSWTTFEFSFLHEKWQHKSCQLAYGVECKLWKKTDAKKIKQS